MRRHAAVRNTGRTDGRPEEIIMINEALQVELGSLEDELVQLRDSL